MAKKKTYVTYKDFLNDELKDPTRALNYLNEALKDDDEGVFLIALKDVLTAQGLDKTALAKKANLNRQNIYRMLSEKGNPRWNNLASLFGALGMQMKLTYK